MNPLCAECDRHALVTPGEVVDHVKELKDGGDPWDVDNLQTLCREHHQKKSFRQEYLEFLKKFEVKFDEKYLFEFYD